MNMRAYFLYKENLTIALVWSFAMLLMALPTAAKAFDVPVAARQNGFNTLTFEDEFDRLDLSLRGPIPGKWYNGLWYKPPSISGITAASGILSLKDNSSIDTLGTTTEGTHSFRYGYFEARMRFPVNLSNWASFWLFSAQHARGTDNNHWCEIDIFEELGPRLFLGTVHDWIDFKSTYNSNNYHQLKEAINSDQWNVFGLLWKNGILSWYLNDQKLFQAEVPAICSNQDLFLILSTASHQKGTQNSLDVDYVRVFQ